VHSSTCQMYRMYTIAVFRQNVYFHSLRQSAWVNRPTMSKSQEGADLNGDSIVLSNVEELRTRKVQKNGSVHLGREYGDCEITIAFRVEKRPEDDSEDTDD